MAKHTRQSEVLQELFDALGNDPFVIAECLARPALAERLLTSEYDRALEEQGQGATIAELKKEIAALTAGLQSERPARGSESVPWRT